MTRIKITLTIEAPISLVFRTITDNEKYLEAVPDIVKVEYLTEQKSGVGTRFRSIRVTKGRESITELDVTEYIIDKKTRMVADSHGAIWDTTFDFEDLSGATRMTLTMDATAHKFLPKLMIPLMKGMIQKNVERDMESIKSYCEK